MLWLLGKVAANFDVCAVAPMLYNTRLKIYQYIFSKSLFEYWALCFGCAARHERKVLKDAEIFQRT
jgi:hypothetical protein